MWYLKPQISLTFNTAPLFLETVMLWSELTCLLCDSIPFVTEVGSGRYYDQLEVALVEVFYCRDSC